jgi:hypothetical protein
MGPFFPLHKTLSPVGKLPESPKLPELPKFLSDLHHACPVRDDSQTDLGTSPLLLFLLWFQAVGSNNLGNIGNFQDVHPW